MASQANVYIFGMTPLTAYDILTTICVSILIIVIGMIMFYCMWIRTTNFYIPRGSMHGDAGRYVHEGEDVEQISDDRIKTDTFWSFLRHLIKIVLDLDPEYWTKYAGTGGIDMSIIQRMDTYCFKM